MNRKTIYMLVGLLIVMLAVLGVGYALWFEDLKIHGEVTTGELDVQFSLYDPVEWFTDENNIIIDNPDPTKFDSVTCESDFVAYYGLLDSPDGSAADDGYEVISFEVAGMYPSYHCMLQFDITSTSTVPVHFYGQIDPEDAGVENMIVDDLSCVRRDGGDMGCTLTQGYWKTHTRYDTHTDPTWAGREDAPFFSSGMTYYEILWTPPQGDPYIILAHQYIAAQLNGLHGAVMPAYVQAAFDAATAYFNGTGSYPDGASELLDRYNNGLEGVPHCDVVDEDGPSGGGDTVPIEDFQLHQGETIDCFLELHFDNTDGIAESGSYEFQYHIRAYQWNEDDYVQTSLEQSPFNYDWSCIVNPASCE